MFDPAKAACQLRRSHDNPTTTPDQDDCRPSCANIAYTDRDITQLAKEALGLPPSAARAIRRRYAEGEVSLADLAEEYSVGRSTSGTVKTTV